MCLNGYGYSSIEKYAGGLYNHYLYWWTLTAPSCAVGAPTGKLLSKIEQTWGNFTIFVNTWNAVSNAVFGNGWTWLCVNQAGGLEIQTSIFQFNPLFNGPGYACYPVLGIDLWEHAYYLTYTYNRAQYVEQFWNIIDWPVVQYFYENFASELKAVPM